MPSAEPGSSANSQAVKGIAIMMFQKIMRFLTPANIRFGGWAGSSLVFIATLGAQNPVAVSQFFEGKQVVVKMDMPGTQQGVDIYPQRPQQLDVKSYSNRLKKFGTSLRNGDTVMITKVKVKDDNIEFQLGGGGYGTAFDDTDSSVHFTPSEKSGREKELEDQLRSETDPARRRSLQRELDDVRADRERRDARDRNRATEAAEARKDRIDSRRAQGGSRFNIRLDTRKSVDLITPQFIMTALAPYVDFPPGAFGESQSAPGSEPPRSEGAPPPPATQAAAEPSHSLKKGMTREQVEKIFGPPADMKEHVQGGLKVVTCTYQSKDAAVQADFVNGVLVQYSLSSR
jgi:hypothetical protein